MILISEIMSIGTMRCKSILKQSHDPNVRSPIYRNNGDVNSQYPVSFGYKEVG